MNRYEVGSSLFCSTTRSRWIFVMFNLVVKFHEKNLQNSFELFQRKIRAACEAKCVCVCVLCIGWVRGLVASHHMSQSQTLYAADCWIEALTVEHNTIFTLKFFFSVQYTTRYANMSAWASFEFVGVFNFIVFKSEAQWLPRTTRRQAAPRNAESKRKRHSTLITINIWCARGTRLWGPASPANASKYLNVHFTMSGHSLAAATAAASLARCFVFSVAAAE